MLSTRLVSHFIDCSEEMELSTLASFVVKPVTDDCETEPLGKLTEPLQLRLTVLMAEAEEVVLKPFREAFRLNDGRFEQLLRYTWAGDTLLKLQVAPAKSQK